LCRAGFEGEAAAEAAEAARARGAEVRTVRADGHALLEPREPPGAAALARLSALDLIFARQVFAAQEKVPLPFAEKAVPVLAEAAGRVAPGLGLRGFSSLFVEAPDTDGGRRLWPACGRLAEGLGAALTAKGLVGPRSSGPRLHVFLPNPSEALLGTSDPGRSSPWPMGIPRLRFPSGAPSRSVLKLEEALLTFVPEGERPVRLRPGMRAADLGASPGGWTWHLASRGLVVTAVDNGPLDRALLETGLVEHVRADAFTWRPPRPMDWLVCDLVAAPARVAKLVGVWAAGGRCREAVFNLKLPSAGRLAQVHRCAKIIARELDRSQVRYSLRFKHLYHDREEVTGHLRVNERPEAPPRLPQDAPPRASSGSARPPRPKGREPTGRRGRRRSRPPG
jgi:23S rRNA (cytidine2498-2'-O)-methyltransferase